MDKKNNLLIIASDVYGRPGGIAEYNRNFIKMVSESNLFSEIKVYARSERSEGTKLPPEVDYNAFNSTSKIKFLFYVIFKSFIDSNINLIFCGHINLLPLAWILSIIKRADLVLQIHGIEAWQPKKIFIQKIFLRRVSSVLSVSHFTRKKFQLWSEFPRPIYVIPNCIDINKISFSINPDYSQIKYVRQFSNSRKILLSIGRMESSERYKGVDTVIKLFASNDIVRDGYCYVVCGDGDDLPRLTELTLENNLSNSILFLGYVDETLKYDLLKICDKFILAGTGEGFGIVILEALACGAQVIASNRDGSQEAVLNGRLGTVVDPLNDVELTSAILNFDPSIVNLQEFEKNFEMSNCQKQLSEILSKIKIKIR